MRRIQSHVAVFEDGGMKPQAQGYRSFQKDIKAKEMDSAPSPETFDFSIVRAILNLSPTDL